jgi:hypothetical protein
MQLRRIIGVLATATLAAAIAGCGGSATTATTTMTGGSVAAPGADASAAATAWTALAVSQPAGAPVQIQSIVPWSGGYVAFGRANATAPDSGWTSADGRAWTAIGDQTFGLDAGGSSLIGGTACGSGVIVAIATADGPVTLWSTTDAAHWTRTTSPAGSLVPALAGSAVGAVATAAGQVYFTSDCSTWHAAGLPGAAATIAAVAAFGGGFAAVGFGGGGTGDSGTTPLAWSSADGRTWAAATVPADTGLALTGVAAGGHGLIAYGSSGGSTPGPSTFLTSPDGRAWTIATTEPLGTQGSGADTRLNGGYAGDGTHLLGSGQTASGDEYWISTDGTAWTKLAFSPGPAPAVILVQPFLMRDGILFSGDTTSYGAVVAP